MPQTPPATTAPTTPTASEALRLWCDASRGRARQLALTLGVSERAVGYWRSGLWRPRPHHWDAIEQHTGGEVPAGLWADAVQVRRQPRLRLRTSLTPEELHVLAACLSLCEPRMTPEGQRVAQAINAKLVSIGVSVGPVPPGLA